jgi:hypothetical protein
MKPALGGKGKLTVLKVRSFILRFETENHFWVKNVQKTDKDIVSSEN